MTDEITAWIGPEGRTVEAMAFDDVTVMARAVLQDFWAAYPEHRTEDQAEALDQLHAIAKVAGFKDAARLCGSAVVGGDGHMTLELRAV